ncbi:AAA family ATPase [Shinella sp.]|uniref:AAA family ATPase n=1 Tax=Shinella sp. TaxID=1870904 RepID=UPI003F72099F
MRYVSREKVRIPDVLSSPAVDGLRAELTRYAANQDGLSGQQRAPLDQSVLTDPSISAGLVELFEDRCGYCEQRLNGYSRPPLEHHRPLGVAQGKDGRTDQAHYSWLAYEWHNMIAVCEDCRKRKQNHFFVEGNRGPVNASIADLRVIEDSLLIDPCFDDPAKHLRFGTDGTVQPLSAKGKETISLLSLNRPELVENRYRALNDAAGRLAESPLDLLASSTELSNGNGAVVMSVGNHPGATSLALLEAASEQGRNFDNINQMLEELSRMDLGSRRSYVEALLAGPAAEASIVEESFALPPARRLPGLAEMPAAKAAITTVSIRNFKGLTEIDFRIPDSLPSTGAVPCMILLGENATGKSSVLEAITLALLGTVETEALNRLILDEDVNPAGLINRPDLEHWDKVADQPIDVTVGFFGSRPVATLTATGSNAVFGGTEGPSKIVLAYGPRRYFSKKKARRFRSPAHRVRSLFDPMATIANPSDWLLDCPSAHFEPAVRALREILMLETNDYFARENGHIVIESSAGRIRLEEMSVGYKSIIAMATDIVRELLRFYDNLEYASATVLIDEIETHLHPRWKMRIMSCLRRAFPQVQFIVTTHDPLCLRGMHDGEVFVLHRADGDQQIEKLENLPTTKGMRAEQLLTSEFFGLGSTDPETDAKLAIYHDLASRQDNLNERETRELTRLKGDLEENMVVGDTPFEQALVDILRKAEVETRTEPTKTALPRRASILSNALQRLTSDFASSPRLTGTELGSNDTAQSNNGGTTEA